MGNLAVKIITVITVMLAIFTWTASCSQNTEVGSIKNREKGYIYDYTFEKPEELVAYESIINTYGVKVTGEIGEKDIQEIFTILKDLNENIKEFVEQNDSQYIYIDLKKMKISQNEERKINVYMSDVPNPTSGYTTDLDFTKTAGGNWFMEINMSAIH